MDEGGPTVAVILCGGPGARLWPLSRSQRTKPFIELPGGGTLFGELVASLAGAGVAELVVVAGAAQLEHCQAELAALEGRLPPARLVIEPEGRGTAPALAAALRLIEGVHGPDATFMMYPADHHVKDRAALNAAVAEASKIAAAGRIVVLGVEPTHPSTQYGYIVAGEESEGRLPVASFVEKPAAKRAEELLAAGSCYWNAGMFGATVETMLQELKIHAPEVAAAAAALEPDREQRVWTIDPASWLDFPVIMVDHAVAEKTALGTVVPVACGWSDLGGFDDWFALVAGDGSGNRVLGDHAGEAIFADAADVGVLAESGRTVAVAGCADLRIVDLPDALLVAGEGSAGSLRAVVAKLGERDARALSSPAKERRAWGSYCQLGIGPGWQVKRIEVLPGRRLSLQAHAHRCENWIVVQGAIEVTIDDDVRTLRASESCFIPQGARHRMANRGAEPATVIEVQSGAYLGEDDITRYEDDFGRA